VQAEGLSASERKSLRARIDDVRLLYASSERTDAESANKLLDLDNAQSKALDDLIHLLEALGGRLHHEPTKDPTP